MMEVCHVLGFQASMISSPETVWSFSYHRGGLEHRKQMGDLFLPKIRRQGWKSYVEEMVMNPTHILAFGRGYPGGRGRNRYLLSLIMTEGRVRTILFHCFAIQEFRCRHVLFCFVLTEA